MSAKTPATEVQYGDPDLDEVVRLERQLLDPSVRADRDRVAALLHPEWMEYGASGRIWTRDSVIDALAADPAVSGTATDFSPVRLADDVVLLTFRIVGEVDRLRSSVWVRDSHSGWLQRFHQGTRAATQGQ